jgi:hypothetical protein
MTFMGELTRRMRWPVVVLSVLAFAMLGTALHAQQSLRAEKTLKYRTDAELSLDVRVGPVKLSTVKIKVGGGTGIGAAIKAKAMRFDPETQALLQFAFDVENPDKDEWQVTYTVELLDAKGQVVDHFTSKDTYEGEAKTTTAEHVMLKAAVPLVDKVRFKFQAALD